jgi:2-keto-4-pentenoate hydratase
VRKMFLPALTAAKAADCSVFNALDIVRAVVDAVTAVVTFRLSRSACVRFVSQNLTVSAFVMRSPVPQHNGSPRKPPE